MYVCIYGGVLLNVRVFRGGHFVHHDDNNTNNNKITFTARFRYVCIILLLLGKYVKGY